MAGVYLRQAVRAMHTSVGSGPNFEFAATSCQGWRNTMEDVHVIIPYLDGENQPHQSSLFAVFDGHNGVEVSTYAAKYLPEYIRRNRKYQNGHIVDGLKEAFILLDNSMLLRESVNELREIRRMMHPNIPEYTPGFTSGSTAVVCLLKNNNFYCANIGDSRCVLSRNGRAVPLSVDTKPDDPQEMARIERAGGTVMRGRINMQINVSRAFGDHMYKCNPDLQLTEQMIIALPDVIVEPYNEKTDQFMVLMCDGIWNSMTNEDVIQYIGRRIRTDRLSQITEDIIRKILPEEMPERGIQGKDNMTIVIVKFINQATMMMMGQQQSSMAAIVPQPLQMPGTIMSQKIYKK
ncbi:protein phosphatase 2C-like protein [Euroglyphus maynei]|uniref:protein-serine/threonine phosphatase n=1 Tax=Euroglyphus maynei TaxID=6958 RepID=A0A1Y3B8W7_EURMA|nr:protein phosphatase 2C-like protein [Euroglyphus maynei]